MKTTKPQKQKSEEAAKKHANAERLRRDRINLHLTKLRSLLLPNRSTSKTVKASILAETVRQVQELKKKAADQMALGGNWEGWCGGGGGERGVVSGSFMFPGESDEATVSCGEGKMVKATVCCEDRPGLNRELTEAIRSVGARAVRAEMATVGGRTKAELLVQCREGGAEEEGVRPLRRALKLVVETGASDCSGLGQLLSLNRYNGLGLEIPANKWAGVSGSFNSSGAWEKLLLSTFTKDSCEYNLN